MDYLESEEGALKLAMENEKMASEFYEKARGVSKTELSKRTFEFLAKQEVEHFDMLKKMQEHEFEFNPNYQADENAVKLFFDKRKEYDSKLQGMDELEAYKMGMELEKKSYEFYKKAFENAENEDIKKFFKFLMEWESKHYHLLENAMHYLEDPVQYNVEQEQWDFEG